MRIDEYLVFTTEDNNTLVVRKDKVNAVKEQPRGSWIWIELREEPFSVVERYSEVYRRLASE